VFPVPDGDTGTNMSLTLLSAVKELETIENFDLEIAVKAAAWGALIGARGNSGVIIAQLFAGFNESAIGKQRLYGQDIALAFQLAAKKAYDAVINPIEGTLLTVMRDTANAAEHIVKTEKDLTQILEFLLAQAKQSVENTPNLLPILKQAGVVDSGSLGFVYFLEGMVKLIRGQENEPIEDDTQEQYSLAIDTEHNWHYRYCTEFIIEGANLSKELIKTKLTSLGDSLLIVGNNNFFRVHIHTTFPEEVFKAGELLGKISEKKIDDMLKQHQDIIAQRNISLIVICLGEGLKNIFNDSGAEYVIDGGPGANPSVGDIQTTINRCGSSQVIVIPNNNNILAATIQAVRLIKEKQTAVIETRNIPQAIAALMAFNDKLPLKENVQRMSHIISQVKSGEIAIAQRSAEYNNIAIKPGEILGIFNDEIKCMGQTVECVIIELLNVMVDDTSDIISLFYGKQVTKQQGENILNIIKNKFTQQEIEVIYGGQPNSLYIISVE
jgi:hypothetical protein